MRHHVVLTSPLALSVAGGGTVHCRALALDLLAAGAEVTLLPVQARTMSQFPRPAPPSGEEAAAVSRQLTEAGIDVRELPQSRYSWWLDGIEVRRQLTVLLDTRAVTGVLGWWGELAQSMSLLAARNVFAGVLAASPYSLWWNRQHGRPQWLHRRMDERLVARTARRASLVFANSIYTAREVTSRLGVESSRIEVVHPPLSARFASPDRVLSGKIERLIFFGRLRPEKGILDLIEALGRLESEGWQLTVVGPGDAGAVLRAMSERGIMERVRMLGTLEPTRLKEELDLAQVAVLPSHEESFGLAVAEAQLAGLPVVAYDAGAVGELCEDGVNGWLVPTGDIDRLSAAIRQTLNDPDETRRRGVMARDRAQRLLLDPPGSKILHAIDTRMMDHGGSPGGTRP